MVYQFGSTRVRALLIVLLCLTLLGGSLVSGNYCPCGTIKRIIGFPTPTDTRAAVHCMESLALFYQNEKKQALLETHKKEAVGLYVASLRALRESQGTVGSPNKPSTSGDGLA